VVLAARSADKLDALADELGGPGQAMATPCDVTDFDQQATMVGNALDAFGRIDVVVNNAGFASGGGTVDDPVGVELDALFAVHFTASVGTMSAAFPPMRAQGYGKIVTISSISGIIGGVVSRSADSPDARRGRSGPAYAAAKGGVIALTRWVAKDVGQSGIYVNSVAPGGVETEMTRGFAYRAEELPIPRMGQAGDVAEAVLFLASPASNYVTGQVLRVDGGWVIG